MSGSKPRLVIVTGRPGAGKTTFAHALAGKIHMPALSRDEVKEGYVRTFGARHTELPETANLAATNAFFELLMEYINRDISVIAEAAFQHPLWSARAQPFIEKARVTLIICDIPREVALARFIKRGLNDEQREYFHGDKGVAMYKQGVIPEPGAYDPPKLPVPTFTVNTLNEYNPSIDEIARMILNLD